MTTEERLRHKISPLENKKFTASMLPLWRGVDFGAFTRKYKGAECVVLSPQEAWDLIYPDQEPTKYDLAVMGRSLQALLWERSYQQGYLVFSKPCLEITQDGY